VSDAVGVVVVGDLELIVAPKIPPDHLIYLLARSGEVPRLDEQPAAAAVSASLWELVARAFVDAAERLLRLGLIRDYQEVADTVDAARGRIEVAGTTRHFFAGRLELDCTFDDFSYDTPLNRVILAASREVTESTALADDLQQRSSRISVWLDGVGAMEPSDIAVDVDRRTSHYEQPIALARHILRHVGRHLATGSDTAWSFLIRTPEMVQRGLMSVLAERLGAARVHAGKRQLAGSTLTFNPDLVFDGGLAIGDVKYKLSAGDWERADLYEVIAFAEAFRSRRAVIIRFREPGISVTAELSVGDQSIRDVAWLSDPGIAAADAASSVADEVAAWLDGAERALTA
jgi:5-methylcytosine-specific restriction endonuclease McrBC regulatory subunit McrC